MTFKDFLKIVASGTVLKIYTIYGYDSDWPDDITELYVGLKDSVPEEFFNRVDFCISGSINGEKDVIEVLLVDC